MMFDDQNRYLIDNAPYVRVTTILAPLYDRAAFVAHDYRRFAQHVVMHPRSVVCPSDLAPDDHAEQLMRRVEQSSPRQHGIDVHAETANFDAGRKVSTAFGAVNAWYLMLERTGLTVVPRMIERTVLTSDVSYLAAGWAGTFDRIVETVDGDQHLLDIKTGNQNYLNWPAIGAQLAAYAHADKIVYGDRLEDLPAVNYETGFVAHIDSADGHASCYQVDLTAGWEIFKTCWDLYLATHDVPTPTIYER